VLGLLMLCFGQTAIADSVGMHHTNWLTDSRAARLEELRDRDALHVAGGVCGLSDTRTSR
jgi:hypothetical protein